jgi:ribose transport system substrate-binding protein
MAASREIRMQKHGLLAATAAMAFAFMASVAMAAGPETVKGPGADPACFKPWDAQTKFFEWPAKKGPYRIALVNGYVGNTWRIQMIQTAKAYSEQADIKADLKEFKVISTGLDAAAQLGAIEDFINQGYDAIIINAVSTDGFDRVIRLADRAGVILVPFDNVLDSDKVMQVNEDQYSMGVQSAQFLLKELGDKKEGQILEVRGVPGNSVDRDRHDGFQATMKASGGKWNIVEVNGNWDDGTAQKATADALAVHGHFDGLFTQGGSTGSVRALMDAKHPFIPMAGEGENGFRKLVAEHEKDGLKGFSYGQSPALVAISIKAAISALKGNPMPQLISVPIPEADYTTLKDGVNYWSDLTDNFFAVNDFPPCGVNFKAAEIMGKTAENVQ